MSETKGIFIKRCIIPGRLDGKIAVVTGANTGIGLYTAGELARRGAIVIMACRNMERAKAGKDKLLARYSETNVKWMTTDVAHSSLLESLRPIQSEQLVIEQVDLGSLESVRSFANRVVHLYSKIHYLINNAGLFAEKYSNTKDGFEQTMGVNHLGPFLLTELLLPVIRAAAPSRIINVSSMAHYHGQLFKPDLQLSAQAYNPISAYASSKLSNMMHAMELSNRLEGTNVTALGLHPGIVNSELGRNITSLKMVIMKYLVRPILINSWDGAQTTLYAVLVENPTPGGYCSNFSFKAAHSLVNNDEERKWFWQKSCELVGWPVK